ncbi:MAG: STAS domain-containing protein [Planctomycetota bacterium]
MAILDFDSSSVELANGEKAIAVSLTGSIDATTNQQFEQELTDILAKGVKKVILVLRGIKYINSTGLGTIVKCVDIYREAGGDIKMVGIPTKVIALFEMLGLLALFETFDQLDEAVISYATAAQEAAAPKRLKQEFPIQFKCTSCTAGVNLREPGKYKCPKCGDYFAAAEDGTIETYSIRKPNVVQLQIPADARFVESVKQMAAASVQRFGIPADLVQNIAASIDAVFSTLDNGGAATRETMTVLMVADEQKLSIGFVSYQCSFNLPAGDPRIKTIRQYMDEVEVVKLPPKGTMIKMNKVFSA